MNTDKSVIYYIILLPIVSIILLMSFIVSYQLNIQKASLEVELQKMQNLYISNEKKIITYQVKNVINYINYSLEETHEPIDKIKQDIIKMTSNIKFGERGYVFIVDKNGSFLTHRNKKIVGTNAFNIKDPTGFYYMKEGYIFAKKDKEVFLEYISITNTDMPWNNEKKLTYIEYFEKFGWTVNAGVYLKDIAKITQKYKKQLEEKYDNENKLLILVSSIFALIVIGISILLSRKIAKVIKEKNLKKDVENKELAKMVKERTSNLRHNLAFTNKLINTIPVPIYVKDHNFKYIDCNEAFCEYTQKSKKEIIGKSIDEVVLKDLAEFNYKKDKEIIDNDISYQNYKYVYHGEDTKVYEFYKAKFLHKKGINAIIGVVFDITQKELLAKSLKQEVAAKTIQNLNQSKKFEEEQMKNVKFTAIGQLSAGITHEINTPLTYIMGNFEMMEYDINELPNSNIKTRMQKDSIKINDGLKRIANIIDSMREMSQKSKEEKEIVNIYHTLVTSLTMAHNRAKQITKMTLNSVEFDMDCEKDSQFFNSYIQRQRVEQVWVIIINNALDELTRIDRYEQRSLDITIEFSDLKDEIIVKFKDNAGGISDEIMDKIFEPFSSTKDYGGIGIGLNVAKRIIDEQDGKILAYNEGLGAVFEIRLKNSDNL